MKVYKLSDCVCFKSVYSWIAVSYDSEVLVFVLVPLSLVIVMASQLLRNNMSGSRNAFIVSRPSFDKPDVTDPGSTSSGSTIQRLYELRD